MGEGQCQGAACKSAAAAASNASRSRFNGGRYAGRRWCANVLRLIAGRDDAAVLAFGVNGASLSKIENRYIPRYPQRLHRLAQEIADDVDPAQRPIGRLCWQDITDTVIVHFCHSDVTSGEHRRHTADPQIIVDRELT